MRLYLSLFFLFIFSLFGLKADTLRVGVHHVSPFVRISPDSIPRGLSIDFWKMISADLDYKVKYKIYPDLESSISGIENEEVDLSINPLTITPERLKVMNFSQPYFISGTTLAMRKVNSWTQVVRNIFTQQFISAVSGLAVIIWIFGFLVWLAERKKNPVHFKKGHKGLWDGFWWSAVTMTTVGQGDKAPKTKPGRVLTIIWMFTAIVLISGLTAGIASSLTVTNINSAVVSVHDLSRLKVATIKGSSAEDYLNLFGIEAVEYAKPFDALKAVQSKKIDVFVYDRLIIEHLIKRFEMNNLTVLPQDLKTDYFGFSLPKSSSFADTINPLILEKCRSNDWQRALLNNKN